VPRELALQCSDVIQAAADHVGLKATCVFGGVPKDPQKKLLRKGAPRRLALHAAPGRRGG
jgi:superfamily II DNA/RNA helicase